MQGRPTRFIFLGLSLLYLLPCAFVSPSSAISYVAGTTPGYAQEVNSGITLQLNVTGAQTFSTYTFTWRVTDPTGTVTTVSKTTGSFLGTFTQSAVFPRDFSAGANTNYVGNYTVRIDQTAPSAMTGVANTRFEIGLMPSKTVIRTFQIVVKAQGYLNGENVTIDVQHGGSSLPGFPTFLTANTTGGVANLVWRPPASTPLGMTTVTFRGSSTLKIPSDLQLFTMVPTNLTVTGLQTVPPLLERTQTFEIRFQGSYASGVTVRSGTALVRVVESDAITTHFVPVNYDNGLGLFRGYYRVGLNGLVGTWNVYVDGNTTDDGYGDVGPSSSLSSHVSLQQALLMVSPSSLSQSYTVGDTIRFFATVTNPDGSAFSSGTVTGSFSHNGVQVGPLLTLSLEPGLGYWTGSYTTDPNDAIGSWVLLLDASDPYGNHGQATASTTVNAVSSITSPTPLLSLPLFLFLLLAGVAGSAAGGLYLLRSRNTARIDGAGWMARSDTLVQIMGGEIPPRSTLLILAEKDEDATELGLELAGRYIEGGNYCGLLAYGMAPIGLLARMKRIGARPQMHHDRGLMDILDCHSLDAGAGGIPNIMDIVDVGTRVGSMLEKGYSAGQRLVVVDSLTGVAKSFPPRKLLGFLSFLGEKVKNEKGILVLPVQKGALSSELLSGLVNMADGIVELNRVPGGRTISAQKTFGRQVRPRPVQYPEPRPPGLLSRLRMYLNLD